MDKEYAGITGVPAFAKAAVLLAYGPDSSPISEDRVAVTQSISGTGALRIGGAFLERHFPGDKTIYIPDPSWANHNAVFKDSGLKVQKYRYYDKKTIGLDFDGMVEDIKKMPKGSMILLHACAHNPTGVDPTEEQWRAISDAVKEGGHYPFFDMAYQGFASGDTNKDAFPIRHFIKEGHQLCLAQSFAKNMVRDVTLVVGALADVNPGSLRRACRCFLDSVRVSGREEACRLSNQDHCSTAILQPSGSRSTNCLDYSQRLSLEQAMARGSKGHGRPYHHHACLVEREPREVGKQARLEPHYISGML